MAILASDVDKHDGVDSWQAAMADSIREPAELCRLLGLDPALFDPPATDDFSMLVPRPFVSRMDPGNPRDPLLVQVMPAAAENTSTPGFETDPLAEAQAALCPGLLSKYQGRSLIVTTGACAVHCRYCFRRHFPEESVPKTSRDWGRLLSQIASRKSTREVILSGGDPLALSDRRLGELITQLAEIPHLTRLRLHTRLPVMIPQRVTSELLGLLRGTRLTPVVVVQINHPAEIDTPLATALGGLVDSGVPVLNQSVLLRGVNDSVETLCELCTRLVDIRVVPYYLHQLDSVSGAAHFRVSQSLGIRLIEQLRDILPGYAVPRYVRELPGGRCKQVLA